jgi:poly(3-hydroxybutyrate) depolymerase
MKKRICAAVLVAAAVSLCWRIAVVAGEGPVLRIITLPHAGATRWVDCMLPERTGALLAARWLQLSDGGEALEPVLADAYARMDAALGAAPTPAIATYLGLQRRAAFDTIVVEPTGASQGARPESALLFLHGYAGNFDVYCWHLALAAKATNTLVVCPSIGPRGDWWTQRGLDTVRATLAYLHARGIARVYLAGLSNGATGAGVIAPRIAGQLAGLVLISGAPRHGSAPAAVPLLVIQGDRDGMMPPSLARAFVARATASHRYVSLRGGHFIFLSRWREVTATLASWLQQQEQQRHVGSAHAAQLP